MNLRTMIAADLDSVFFNINDLAEEITLDGISMLAVVEELVPASGYGSKSSRVGGTFGRSLYLFIKSPAVLPSIGKRVVFVRGSVSERRTVKERTDDEGITRLKLEAVDS